MPPNEHELAIHVAELRSDVRHIQSDVTDIKAQLSELRDRIDKWKDSLNKAKIWAVGLYVAQFGSLLFVMARGFKWI